MLISLFDDLDFTSLLTFISSLVGVAGSPICWRRWLEFGNSAAGQNNWLKTRNVHAKNLEDGS
jgi:hypothetical protein